MRKTLDLEIKVGIFVGLGLILIMSAILMLGGSTSWFTKQISYSSHFPSADGLVPGAKVVLGGVSIGTIDSVDFDPTTKNIKVIYTVNRKYQEWIRQNSTAEISTQGVLGDKYISLNVGTEDSKMLAAGGEIPNLPSKSISEFISKGDQLMINLNSISTNLDQLLKSFQAGNKSETFFQGMAATAKNLSQATAKLNQEMSDFQFKSSIRNLNSIMEKINNGTGTLGALVNDPGLYYDIRALMGGANRNRIVRNLVRKTIQENEEQDKTSSKK